jgi:hypothetical protein
MKAPVLRYCGPVRAFNAFLGRATHPAPPAPPEPRAATAPPSLPPHLPPH